MTPLNTSITSTQGIVGTNLNATNTFANAIAKAGIVTFDAANSYVIGNTIKNSVNNQLYLLLVNYTGGSGGVNFSDPTKVTPFILQKSPSLLVVTAGACPIDWSLSNSFYLTLSANITSMTFSNALPGQTITIRLTNTVSNYTVAWPAGTQWVGGTPPVMTTGAKSDIYQIFYDGTNYFGSFTQNLS